MPSINVQALLLAATIPFSLQAGDAIGVAQANGSFQVDSSRVFGNTTLFDGATVETDKASSRLSLNSGARLELGTDSRARVFEKRLMLERGIGEIESASAYQVEARSLRISTASAKAVARVKLEGKDQVLVAALNGPVRVHNEIGLLVANMDPGTALLLTPQAGQAGAFQMSGCLVQTRDGKFLLVNPNQTVELRGAGLAREANSRVEITGSAFRSAVAVAPASQVVQVDTLNQVGVGGCLESIAKVESAGVKVVRPGGPPAPGAKEPVAKGGSNKGLIAGVVVAAAAGGVGAVVATQGKGKSSP